MWQWASMQQHKGPETEAAKFSHHWFYYLYLQRQNICSENGALNFYSVRSKAWPVLDF